MKAKELQALLFSLRACGEAVDWAKGKPLAKAWKDSGRADWMLWLCGRMAGKPGWPTRQQVVFAACQCARVGLKHAWKGEGRPLAAIESAERWSRGEATLEEVRKAAAAAYAAADDGAEDDTRSAAYYAAASAAAAAEAAVSAAAAAAAADYAAADTAVRTKTLRELATLVRKHLKMPAETGKR